MPRRTRRSRTSCAPSAQNICGPPSKGATRRVAPMSALGQKQTSRGATRTSGCGARGGAGERRDVGEHAAGVPGRERSHERRGAVELDAAVTGGLRPGKLAGVPFDEGFGFRSDVEVLVEAGVRLADLCVSELDEQPVALAARSTAEIKADDDASIRESVLAKRIAHRPQRHKGVEVLRSDFEPTRTPLAERPADREEVVACSCELVVVPAPVGLGCRLDDTEPFEML